jgi:hypothetical protein
MHFTKESSVKCEICGHKNSKLCLYKILIHYKLLNARKQQKKIALEIDKWDFFWKT